MEMVKGGEIVHDDVTIPQITVNQEKFNTVNLQQEIAKGMQQIMEAKGKNEVADTMDTIKKIVEDNSLSQARKGAGRSMHSSRKRQSISLQMKR